ncbi:helix-turn-helix domain-containing protein [Paenibacillus sedimenti]|uniref:AraC family transcriptional regulator n=1 Tax=Paenibacillus sedimenti TaxID=2770274 RepID=A0A926KUC2_9BACL|nr:AraC family transcriptional regulator [Paenibacillus sedimenti]MBD0382304.1 AraC family transcriptional regulator [Paenibacillus sedimenti]
MTAILHARSKSYFWKGKGALSIKTFRNGRAFYHTGRGHFAVAEGSYLLLNHGQEYTITIESEVPIESFCIFFPENLVEEVYRSLAASNEQLLDDPFAPKQTTIDFVEKTYSYDEWIAPALSQLRAEYTNKQEDSAWLEEMLYEIAQNLLQVHRQVNKDMMKLQSLKASTREELFKRLHVCHDFISAYYDQPITLAEMARAACLSPNHLLRSYKQLFGMSPGQFLTEMRLKEAKTLLLRTDKSVTDICLEVGFQSVSSFSGLFAKRFASPPSQFRQKK